MNIINESGINIYVWEVENPTGVIQILHGAMEYITRYDEFAKFLNKHSFTVIGHNHPGHGDRFDLNNTNFHEMGSKEKVINDCEIVYNFAKKRYPNTNISLLGHSMGSIIARNLILENFDYSKIILTGIANPTKLKVDSGFAITKVVSTIKGKYSSSILLNYLMFDVFRTMSFFKYRDSNWLTHDQEIVKKYLENNLCGNKFSNNSMKIMLELLKTSILPISYSKLSQFDFLVISGKEDPVGNFGKDLNDFKTQIAYFSATPIKEENIILLDNMKHEVLNEIDKNKTYELILNFLK